MQDVRVSLALFVGANSGTLFGVPLGSIARAENVGTASRRSSTMPKSPNSSSRRTWRLPSCAASTIPTGGRGISQRPWPTGCSRCTGGSFRRLPNVCIRLTCFSVPLWGLYANILAQLVSQVSSHVVVTIIESRCRLLPNPKKSNCN